MATTASHSNIPSWLCCETRASKRLQTIQLSNDIFMKTFIWNSMASIYFLLSEQVQFSTLAEQNMTNSSIYISSKTFHVLGLICMHVCYVSTSPTTSIHIQIAVQYKRNIIKELMYIHTLLTLRDTKYGTCAEGHGTAITDVGKWHLWKKPKVHRKNQELKMIKGYGSQSSIKKSTKSLLYTTALAEQQNCFKDGGYRLWMTSRQSKHVSID